MTAKRKGSGGGHLKIDRAAVARAMVRSQGQNLAGVFSDLFAQPHDHGIEVARVIVAEVFAKRAGNLVPAQGFG